MEFLREVLGEELYSQVAEKINAHNGDEANKEKQIKIGNLGGGEYVGKGKHDALQALLDSKSAELDAANGLIADLQKGTKGNEEMQSKIKTYETETIPELQRQLQAVKINAALKVALLAEKATDIDYLTYVIEKKMREEGNSLELDENEHIKGWDDLISGLRVQCPNQFETTATGRKVLGDNRLPTGDDSTVAVTKEQFAKMGYNERLKLKEENETLFKQLAQN